MPLSHGVVTARTWEGVWDEGGQDGGFSTEPSARPRWVNIGAHFIVCMIRCPDPHPAGDGPKQRRCTVTALRVPLSPAASLQLLRKPRGAPSVASCVTWGESPLSPWRQVSAPGGVQFPNSRCDASRTQRALGRSTEQPFSKHGQCPRGLLRGQ